MLEKFREFIREHDLFQAHHRLLLAVSGGVDSVVLAHLTAELDVEMGLAHVNFQLRGEDSDADAEFVQNLAEELDTPFHTTECDTKGIMAEQKRSMQVVARDFRYSWLEGIRAEEGYDWILLGHHLQDNVETVLHHFARGTGLRGLHGIPLRRGRLLRPLLFATRQEIMEYAVVKEIPFREDSSNSNLKYTRNRIRHEVIPELQKVNPNFLQVAAGNIGRLKEAEYLMDIALKHLRESLVSEAGDRLYIDLEGLLQHYPAAGTILYEWLNPFGFNADQVFQMLESAGRQPGGEFLSPTHHVVVDRENLILERLPDGETRMEYFVHQDAETVYLPDGIVNLNWKEGAPDLFPTNPHIALLDIPPQAFPLRLRHWREGDTFCPLGMNGKHQKLQDFFTNNKIPRLDKGRIWLMETHEGEICWVIGYRVDERFRIGPETAGYLHFHFKAHDPELT